MRSDITSVFNQVYDETYDEVMKFVMSRTGDCNAASDILQDVYKSLYVRFRNKGTDDIDDFKGFLIVSASNVIKKHYAFLGEQRATVSFNSVKDEAEQLDEGSVRALEYELSAEMTGIDEKVAASEMAEKVLEFLEQKGASIKELFVLHFFCGLTIKEAALNTGIRQSDAVNLIYRNIKEMRTRFEL